MTDKDIDTMTPEELSYEIAKAMGWRLEPYWGADKEPAWVDANGKWKCWPAHLPSPSTNWSDWGSVYEFMRGEGWKSSHDFYLASYRSTVWGWSKNGRTFSYDAPDIRLAMVKSALKALRGEGKGE